MAWSDDGRGFARTSRITATNDTGAKTIASAVAPTVPPTTAVPIAMRFAAPAPAAMASGSVPRAKAIEVITIGRSRSCAALTAACSAEMPASRNALANSTIRMAFLDDQADGGEQPRRDIDVVVETAQQRGADRPDDAQRLDQRDRDRDRPAFAQRRQAQQDYDPRDGVERAGLSAGFLLLIGEAGPFETNVRRQLRDQSPHRRQRRAGAAAGRRGAEDFE
jgi:hypothetical protein